MNNISPIWIVVDSSMEEYKLIMHKINKQFSAFASSEFSSNFDMNHHRWWHFSNIRDLRNPDDHVLEVNKITHLPALNLPETFDLNSIVVIFLKYDYTREFVNEKTFFDTINEQKQNKHILQGINNVFFYGVNFIKSEANKINEQIISNQSPFNAILFLGDVNRNNKNNPYGFDKAGFLKSGKTYEDSVFEYATLVIFHLGLSKDYLNRLASMQNKILATAGIYCLNFIPEDLKNRVAIELLLYVFSRFCSETKSKMWADEKEALKYVKSSGIESKIDWKSIYEYFVSNFETKDEANARNKEINKILYKPSVSPWSLFSQWLIPVYFKRYIKELVSKLREAAHSFMFGTVVNFNNHLNKKHQDVLHGSSELSVNVIGKLLKNIWAENNDLENPAGLQHILLVLEKMDSFINSQIQIVQSLKDQKTPSGSNFPLVDDYPLKNIPKTLSSDYVDFVQHGAERMEFVKDDKNSFEKTTLTKLVQLLQFHPIPLSLFTRTLILAIVAPLVILAILIIFPDFLVNSSPFESKQGAIRLFAGCFALLFVSAVIYYWYFILQKIRASIKKYLAWIFWKTQLKLFKNTLEQQLKYYQTLSSECSRIKQNITDGFIPTKIDTEPKQADEIWEAFKSTLFPKTEPKFEQGMFQRDILGKFDDEWPILDEDLVDVKILFNKRKYTLSSLIDEKNKALLFKSLFIESGINPQILYQFLFEKVITSNDEQGDKQAYFDKIRQKFCTMLINELKSRVSLENSESIQELIFRNAAQPPGHNFKKNPNNIFTNKLIQSRYYPSVLLNNLNPYSQLSYIIPEDKNFDDTGWAKVFGNNRRPDHIIHRKSIVSIMQTFSLDGLTDIIDEEKVQTNINQ